MHDGPASEYDVALRVAGANKSKYHGMLLETEIYPRRTFSCLVPGRKTILFAIFRFLFQIKINPPLSKTLQQYRQGIR